jgi:hypothetical protein
MIFVQKKKSGKLGRELKCSEMFSNVAFLFVFLAEYLAIKFFQLC